MTEAYRQIVGSPKEFGALIRHQLENLLRIVSLEHNGAVVEVDSFSFRTGPASPPRDQNAPGSPLKRRTASMKWAKLAAYKGMEPRLLAIGSLLSRLLQVVEFEYNGLPVAIDGFRLKNLAYWARYSFPSLFANLNFESLTSACSCDCEFCFLDGLGPHSLENRMLSLQEARTRARYYSADKKTGLPLPAALPGEPFLHPHLIEFLRISREAECEVCFSLTTNGDFLTEKTIDQLAELKPILLTVSLNSADFATRTKVMRSRRSETAIESIPLLRAKGIPFIGSIVASPSFTLEDIARTAHYLDRHFALLIRLLLTGYTRFQSPAAWFDTKSWWGEIVRLGHTLRAQLATPIFIQPNFYWDQDITARIDGVYRNSPAERAGLKAGDRVMEIDGRAVFTKADVGDALERKPPGGDARRRRVKIKRGQEEVNAEISIELSPDDDYYPYKPRGYKTGVGDRDASCLGVHVAQGFRLEYLRHLKLCVEKHAQARRVLLFTTPLVKGHLAQAMGLVGDLPECRIENVEMRIAIAPHNYWGGNIMIGDLNVAQDYVDHLNALQEYDYRPDLAIIPRSFVNLWGFDVIGESYTEIERRTGIPVELLPVEQIMS